MDACPSRVQQKVLGDVLMESKQEQANDELVELQKPDQCSSSNFQRKFPRRPYKDLDELIV